MLSSLVRRRRRRNPDDPNPRTITSFPVLNEILQSQVHGAAALSQLGSRLDMPRPPASQRRAQVQQWQERQRQQPLAPTPTVTPAAVGQGLPQDGSQSGLAQPPTIHSQMPTFANGQTRQPPNPSGTTSTLTQDPGVGNGGETHPVSPGSHDSPDKPPSHSVNSLGGTNPILVKNGSGQFSRERAMIKVEGGPVIFLGSVLKLRVQPQTMEKGRHRRQRQSKHGSFEQCGTITLKIKATEASREISVLFNIMKPLRRAQQPPCGLILNLATANEIFGDDPSLSESEGASTPVDTDASVGNGSSASSSNPIAAQRGRVSFPAHRDDNNLHPGNPSLAPPLGTAGVSIPAPTQQPSYTGFANNFMAQQQSYPNQQSYYNTAGPHWPSEVPPTAYGTFFNPMPYPPAPMQGQFMYPSMMGYPWIDPALRTAEDYGLPTQSGQQHQHGQQPVYYPPEIPRAEPEQDPQHQ